MRFWPSIYRTWVLLVLCLGATRVLGAGAEMAPDAVVRRAAEEILRWAAQDKRLQAGEIDDLLKMVDTRVAPHFDFAVMTRLAVGKHWQMANVEQRAELTKQFRRLLIRTYTLAYVSNREVQATVKPLRMAAGETECTVQSLLSFPGNRPAVMVDYDMHLTPEGWKIYNVSVDHVSLVTTYRQDFVERVRASGIEGLIASLTEQNRRSTLQ